MKLSELFQSSLVYLTGNLARRGVGILMIPLYTHFLHPADYAVIEFVELFVAVAGVTFGLLAMSDSMVRIYHDQADQEGRARVVSTAIIGMAIVNLAIVAIAMPLAGPLSLMVFGTTDYLWLIRAAFVAMFFGNLTESALAYERMRNRALFFTLYSTVFLALNLCLNVYFIAFRHLGVWGFVLSKVACSIVGAVFLLIRVSREVRWRFQWMAARQMVSFGGPLVLTSISFFIIHFADRFFLNHFANLAEVGIYSLAYKFGFLVTYLVGEPFGNIWNVSLYRHTHQAGWEKQFSRVASYLFLCLFFVAVAISVLAGKAITIVADPAYNYAITLIPILVFGYVFREVGDFFRDILFINKRVLLFGTVTVGAAILNLILDYWLIARYKAAGAAWATLITWLAYALGCWLLAWREHRIPYSLKSFTFLFAISVGICQFAVITRDAPSHWQWGADILLILLFAVTVWLLGYFSSQEKALVKQYLALRREAVASLLSQFR